MPGIRPVRADVLISLITVHMPKFKIYKNETAIFEIKNRSRNETRSIKQEIPSYLRFCDCLANQIRLFGALDEIDNPAVLPLFLSDDVLRDPIEVKDSPDNFRTSNNHYDNGGINVKNPLDSLWGTVISGFVLTGILFFVVKSLVNH